VVRIAGVMAHHADFLKTVLRTPLEISAWKEHRITVHNLREAAILAEKEEREEISSSVQAWLGTNNRLEKDVNEMRQLRHEFPATTHWIINHDTVQQWLSDNTRETSLLHINGSLGIGKSTSNSQFWLTFIGKSVLASRIVDECLSYPSSRTLFFYCHREDEKSRSAVAILSSLIQQMIRYEPNLAYFLYRYEPYHGNELSNLQFLLEACMSISTRLYIIIDGLDECTVDSQLAILKIFRELLQHQRHNHEVEQYRFRFLFTSRNSFEISKACVIEGLNPNTIQILPANTEADISSYTTEWVSRIASRHGPFTNNVMQKLHTNVVSFSEGSFAFFIVQLKAY